jgi:hypothetical protein
VRLKKGKVMKNISVFVSKLVLAIFLCVLVFLPCGCGQQLGETEAEGSRRHKRVLRIQSQEMREDIDRVLLLDRPSKLTDKRIP